MFAANNAAFGVKLGDSGGFKIPPRFGCHG
jgi:hypothetical protein